MKKEFIGQRSHKGWETPAGQYFPAEGKINAHYTWSVRKVSDRIFLCEHLMDYNLARLHEPTLNLSAHA
jgi:hypothetical protein